LTYMTDSRLVCRWPAVTAIVARPGLVVLRPDEGQSVFLNILREPG
jgi:hypothetical protein